VKVVLSWEETEEIAEAGIGRALTNWKLGTKHSAGFKPKDLGFEEDIRGVGAEAAVGKVLGIPWDRSYGSASIGNVDLGEDIEVRSSKIPFLILRPKDSKESRYILVRDLWVSRHKPVYDIVGWLKGGDGMTEDNWTNFGKDRPFCWGVPQSKLNPMENFGQ